MRDSITRWFLSRSFAVYINIHIQTVVRLETESVMERHDLENKVILI